MLGAPLAAGRADEGLTPAIRHVTASSRVVRGAPCRPPADLITTPDTPVVWGGAQGRWGVEGGRCDFCIDIIDIIEHYLLKILCELNLCFMYIKWCPSYKATLGEW